MLIFALRTLGASADARLLPALRRTLCSEDRDLRQAAAEALGRLAEPGVEADLRALLEDPAWGVRAAAAEALLARRTESSADPDGVTRELLLAHRWIGSQPTQWQPVIQLGSAARPALEIALRDDDDVVRREARQVLAQLDWR